MITYYKIRNKNDPELYVKGTPAYQTYDKSGRTFQSIGALRTFITGVMNTDESYTKNGVRKNRIAEWEIVELEVTEKSVKGVHEIITAKKLKELIMK